MASIQRLVITVLDGKAKGLGVLPWAFVEVSHSNLVAEGFSVENVAARIWKDENF